MGEFHDRRFPGEGEAYRSARDRLLQAEVDLRRRLEEVAGLRRELPLGGPVPEDYGFQEVEAHGEEASETRLSELFEESRDALIVYSYMYGPDWDRPCPMCTSILDGLDGAARHVRQRANLAVVAKAPPDMLRRIVEERGWSDLRVLSSHDCSYNADYHAEWESEHGDQHPLVNVFVRRDGEVRHFWCSELYFVPRDGHPRHVDLIWPLWNLLDMTPEGRGTDWMPALEYGTARRA